MNPYLTDDNKPSDLLLSTLDYYGVSLDNFKAMTDEQVKALVKRFNDVLNDGKISSNYRPKSEGNKYIRNESFILPRQEYTSNAPHDSGSFSRYFSLDAWWAERVKKLPESVQKTFPFLIVAKASKSEREKGLENIPHGLMRRMRPDADDNKPTGLNKESRFAPVIRGNIHPTVKPLKIMSYLVTLGSREGDIVLDPFIGSGTTAIACAMLNRKWIGIEINHEYAEIARKRLEPWLRQTKLVA